MSGHDLYPFDVFEVCKSTRKRVSGQFGEWTVLLMDNLGMDNTKNIDIAKSGRFHENGRNDVGHRST